MTEIVSKAIADFEKAAVAYARFTTANDAGKTGSHQSGWLINKGAWPLFFDKAGSKGENNDVLVKIRWQDDFETESRAIYYGKETRNEYRLTRFGRGFPFLQEENVGDYIILLKMAPKFYHAYVLQTDEEIEDFTSAVGISVTDTGKLLYPEKPMQAAPSLEALIQAAAAEAGGVMPSGKWIAQKALEINLTAGVFRENLATEKADVFLLKQIDTEYALFQAIERLKYGNIVSQGFSSIDQFIATAHSILNSRKSRAGHSLEHHLATIFDKNHVSYEQQVKTEGNKTADFIFPDGASYHNPHFLVENLFFMAAKTTCKDRWRQVLNEADRLDITYLMTLQQGISSNQCEEMKTEGVVLVVPEGYKKSFPENHRSEILSLEQFIHRVKAQQ